LIADKNAGVVMELLSAIENAKQSSEGANVAKHADEAKSWATDSVWELSQIILRAVWRCDEYASLNARQISNLKTLVELLS